MNRDRTEVIDEEIQFLEYIIIERLSVIRMLDSKNEEDNNRIEELKNERRNIQVSERLRTNVG